MILKEGGGVTVRLRQTDPLSGAFSETERPTDLIIGIRVRGVEMPTLAKNGVRYQLLRVPGGFLSVWEDTHPELFKGVKPGDTLKCSVLRSGAFGIRKVYDFEVMPLGTAEQPSQLVTTVTILKPITPAPKPAVAEPAKAAETPATQ